MTLILKICGGIFIKQLANPVSPHCLAAAISESTVFVGTLIERSAGIWIYLRYVLEEMRAGSRLPTSLDDLPNGLWDYYTENLDLLRSDTDQWDSFFLPILAALAAAQEPVTPSILAGFANLSVAPGEIVRFLAIKWRPFCIKFSGDRYSLFHQSLRDFLSGAASPGSEEFPDFAATDRSELEAATMPGIRQSRCDSV